MFMAFLGRPWGRIGARLAVAVLLLAAGCPERDPSVLVSGKTVWGEMAVEGVEVVALRASGRGWTRSAATRSGYHGSWVLRLLPGTYRLEARGSLPGPRGAERSLAGVLDGLALPGPGGRVDRVLIPLEPAAETVP